MTLTRSLRNVLLAAGLLVVPSLAHAQSVAGIVRDASGGVLPGVSVEAASPALIEKVRTAVTDGTGHTASRICLPAPTADVHADRLRHRQARETSR